jgi:hypothetical protein
MIRFPLFLLLLSFLILGPASGIDVPVGPQAEPAGAVLLVVDGLGASYVYPEHHAYALDGAPLEGSVLFNLTGRGARAVEVRVPVPETTKSHSVLITGNSATNPDRLGTTIFDLARASGCSAWLFWSGATACQSCGRWMQCSIWATIPCMGLSRYRDFGLARPWA